MKNPTQKDFNAKLHDSKGLPMVKQLTEPEAIKRYGGARMLLAPPLAYDELAKKVPLGKVTTMGAVRAHLAQQHQADFTCPLTAGIFITIAAWASEQRTENITPYWRVLKTDGELNPKYPGGIEAQKAKLEAEGHTIEVRGRNKNRYFVTHYEAAMVECF